MIRPSPKRSLFRQLIQATAAHATEWRSPAVNANRLEQNFRPRVRRLEPRFVLNATAELNALGQLLVMGTADAETVQLQIDGNGDLQLRDETNAIIPIDNHPDGPGFETDPLDPSAITSGEIYFDMGGNNDLLDLALPSGLDVTVQESDGDDNTVLRFADDRLPGTINVDSEQIEIDSGSAMVSAVDANLNLSGDVSFGTDGQSTELKLGSGSLEVTGRLILSGDATISGAGAVG